MPVALRQPPASYPENVKRRGGANTVRMRVVIDRNGHPDSGSVQVVSTPDSALDGCPSFK